MIATLALVAGFALPPPEGGWIALARALRTTPSTVAADGMLTVGQVRLQTARGERRATQGFVLRWQQPEVDEAMLFRWIVDPSELARRIAHAELRRRARVTKLKASPTQVERLLGLLRQPDVAVEDRADALRTLAVVGGQLGADRLAQAWQTLPSDQWRLRAVAVLARSPSKTTRTTLLACARARSPLLQRRCIAALEPRRPRRAP